MAVILFNHEITEDIYMMKILGDFEGAPGQFYMLKPENTFLARPISIFDIDKDGITFLYQKKGKGTAYLAGLKAANEVELFGPMGNGFEVENKSITLIGGGIGVAPLYYYARVLRETYPEIMLRIYLGFTKESYMVDEFAVYANDVNINIGGLITDEVDFERTEKYVTCGPEGMLKYAAGIAKDKGVDLTVSLEEKMACGVGACLGCNIETRSGNKKVCKDGPVFKASEVYYG